MVDTTCIQPPPPSNQSPAYFRENLQRATNFFSSTYDNILLLGDFNVDENEADIHSIMEDNGLVKIIYSATCFKSASGKCIDLIMTNSKYNCFCKARSRQVSMTSIIWYIPSLKLLMTDYRQK